MMIYRLGFITGILFPLVYFFKYHFTKLPESGRWHSVGLIGIFIVLFTVYKLLKGTYQRKMQTAENLKSAKKANYGVKMQYLKALRSFYVMCILGAIYWFMYFVDKFANDIQKVLIVIIVSFAFAFIFEYFAEKKEDIIE